LDRAVSFKPNDRHHSFSQAASRRLFSLLSRCGAYAKRLASIASWRRPTASVLPKTSSFCKAAKAPPTWRLSTVRRRERRENAHRGVGNLFDVKQQAIENLASVGIKVTLVTTMSTPLITTASARSSSSRQKNIDKVQTIAFQPVSFTGRDEDVPDAVRIKQRYTLAGMDA